MKISIIIPAFNEEKRIGKTIETVWEFFKKRSDDFEIIVSDDGSRDNTRQIVKNLRRKFKNLILLEGKHLGKGLAVKNGMEFAKGEIVLFTDADLATPILEFDKFVPKFETGADIVIGSRGIRRHGAPIPRLIMAWGLHLLAKVILALPFSDTQCGFKTFKKEALKKILPKLRIYNESTGRRVSDARVTASFDLELLFLARKLGLKIIEVPVVWQHQASKAVRPFAESLLTLADILKIRINNFLGKYE